MPPGKIRATLSLSLSLSLNKTEIQTQQWEAINSRNMNLYTTSTWVTTTESLVLLRNPSLKPSRPSTIVKSTATGRSSVAVAGPQRTTKSDMSAFEARVSLVFAIASQTSSLSQRLLMELATETAKYVFPSRRFESRTFEEALMSVPDIETLNFKVLSRKDQYEIREVEPYFIAETTMPGKYGFDFNGASQSFNVLAEYLFGKNTKKEKMEMTTPVFTSRTRADGEKMDMTTPVITKKVADQDRWKMSFVMPSKYGSDLPSPKDPSVTIKEVPRKLVAVVAFSGFVSDEEVKHREFTLRDALKRDKEYRVKEGASVEVAQYNPPFTLPFTRRNEIAVEVERIKE